MDGKGRERKGKESWMRVVKGREGEGSKKGEVNDL